jgi:hypothetical protein
MAPMAPIDAIAKISKFPPARPVLELYRPTSPIYVLRRCNPSDVKKRGTLPAFFVIHVLGSSTNLREPSRAQQTLRWALDNDVKKPRAHDRRAQGKGYCDRPRKSDKFARSNKPTLNHCMD